MQPSRNRPSPQARAAAARKTAPQQPADSRPERRAKDRTADDRVALGDLSDSLGYRLRRAQLWVFKDFSRRLARLGLSPAQFSVLAVMNANPGINQLTMASALDIERAGLGRLVDRLESQGLVMRTASAVHGRYYVLHLTVAGAKLLDRARPIIAQAEKALADKLGSTAFKGLLQTLSTFLDA